MVKSALIKSVAAAALLFASASAAIQLPSHIASSMVVQRGVPFDLQGIDAAAAKVTATWFGESYSATADAAGAFKIELPAKPATATPTTINLSSSSGSKAALTDVLVGDVFISSGQSNM